MQSTANVHSYPDTSSRGWLSSVRIPLSIALLSPGLAGISLLPAAAQVAGPAQQTTAASPDAIKLREQELEATRAQQKSAGEAQAKLKADIAAIGQDRSKLNQQLIDIATQVRTVETRIGETEASLRPLDSREQQVRASLDSRRAEIVEVLAALQRAGRRTPPALLVRPEDALQSLRSANLGTLKDPARLSRAIAFASDRGLFAFPVNGRKIREFGGSDGAGGVEKGISLAAKAGAQVTTPCDGWVVYAGPFRSYGQLLILNAGGGYHVLVAGMERISVNIGQFVLNREPVATMGSTSHVPSSVASDASPSVLYVDFR